MQAIEEVSRKKAKTQEQKLDRSINYREAIEGLGTFSIYPPSCLGSVDKKKFGSSTNIQVSKRCQDSLKTVFQEGKNTDMNAIKHANQPKIQSTF